MILMHIVAYLVIIIVNVLYFAAYKDGLRAYEIYYIC